MIATFINTAAVILGALLGFLLHSRIGEPMRKVVYGGAGVVSLVLGIKMSLETGRIVYLALALILGGIIGEALHIEGGILKIGSFLKRRFARSDDSESDFAYAFLNASVIFCVGAMTLVGSFKAGAEGDYELLLTKSVLDGFMAIILSAALGIGVAFAAVTVLAYQGALTLLSGLLRPYATDLVLAELTAVGGALVIMIGINLLGMAKLKTANFLPALILMILLIALETLFPSILQIMQA
jgi:uncharacterized membrane protein YqgA involved in biofilm formation